VGVELKLVRAELAHRFIQALREHAAREDQLLYRWIDEHPSVQTRQLLQHLDT
jgi:hemerythrin-like domain-containing protein